MSCSFWRRGSFIEGAPIERESGGALPSDAAGAVGTDGLARTIKSPASPGAPSPSGSPGERPSPARRPLRKTLADEVLGGPECPPYFASFEHEDKTIDPSSVDGAWMSYLAQSDQWARRGGSSAGAAAPDEEVTVNAML